MCERFCSTHNRSGKNMKRLVIAALLLGACAPEVPTVAETSGGEAVAGSAAVGVVTDALTGSSSLLAVNGCNRTLSNWETTARGKLGLNAGDHWTWTGPLNDTWTGTRNWPDTGATKLKCTLSYGFDSLTKVKRKCTITYKNGSTGSFDWECLQVGPVPPGLPHASEYCTWAGSTVWENDPCN